MAFLDKELQFTAIAPTGTAGDFDSADKVDFGVADSQSGTGEPLVMVFHITAAISSYTDETYDFKVTEDTDASDGSEVILAASGAIAANSAAVAANSIVIVDLPIGKPALRYVGARVTSTGTNPAGLSATCYLMPRSMAYHSLKAHASGFSYTALS